MRKPIDIEYCASDSAGLSASVSIYADRSGLRKQIEEDLTEARFRVLHAGDIATLMDSGTSLIGDVVILDLPVTNAERLAALNRIDRREAETGAELIVSTSMHSLDEVFASVDQSAAQILVDPTRADRVVAVGRAVAAKANPRVSDLSREDRLALLHLSEQVDQIAKRLEGLEKGGTGSLSEHKTVFKGFDDPSASDPVARQSLPDPRYVREIIRRRQARARFFDGDLFADPAWDMLLDLTAAYAEHRRVSVTSLCIASGVPTTTALRWVRQMTDAGLFERVKDSSDKRRAFVSLSDNARGAMAAYFASVGKLALPHAA
uniref:winged helix DNA-binding protein n=1 Tax=uncultured Altererythrobacter sp. TaxID=500840 RepID=UPI002605C413|nr:winged helix DNA-binding protein [uncultured Altererythrobacter sp.]